MSAEDKNEGIVKINAARDELRKEGPKKKTSVRRTLVGRKD